MYKDTQYTQNTHMVGREGEFEFLSFILVDQC